MIKLNDALQGVGRIGLDTSPFIYFVEANPVYLDVIREVFRNIENGRCDAVSSTITLVEVLTQPLRLSNHNLAGEYRDLLYHGHNFHLEAVTAAVAETAADLRARYNLKTPDALQIATAIETRCDAFLCNDKNLQRVTEIPILILDELEL